MRSTQFDAVFCVPEDGHILNDGEAALHHPKLPTYQYKGLSEDDPLTLTDCHLAIEKIICQARLIGFEIARKQMPFFERASRKIMLEGDPGEFDEVLAKITREMVRALRVTSIQTVYASDRRLTDVLGNPVKAHNDFHASSGI